MTNVSSELYWNTFMDKALETITLDNMFEIIESVDKNVDPVSFYDVEKTIRDLLNRYRYISEVVPMADKWKGGTMTLTSQGTSLSSKDIPIDPFFIKLRCSEIVLE